MAAVTHQSFASLIAIEPESEHITHVSANAAGILGHPPAALLGSGGRELLDRRFWHALRNAENQPSFDIGAKMNDAGALGETVDLRAFPSGAALVVEASPRVTAEFGSTTVLDVAQSAMTQLLPLQTEAALANALSRIIRHAMGSDRVCLWRHDQVANATVIAEAKRPSLASALGETHPREPAWPTNAPPVEIIADVDAPKIAFVSHDGAAAPDLSRALSRSPSPDREERLRGCGMAASLRIHLTRAGQSWGVLEAQSLMARRPSADALAFIAALSPFLDAKLQTLPEA